MAFINENTLFILDSYGLIYREYFAFVTRPLTNSKKQNISAVFGFFRNLSNIFRTYKPKNLIAAMDSKIPTFRHEMFTEYKATRQKTPDDLKAQIPWIEEILEVLGVPVIRMDGYEADDVIATLAAKCESEKRNCVILSADKDLMQLASDYVHIMKPDREKIWAELDRNGVEAEWGVPAEKLLDLLSLMGDTADNVPGVSGVGEKTALKLLNEYGTLEGIYENADSIKGKLGEKIRADKENAFLSKKLITLCKTVPISQIETDSSGNFDFSAASKKFTEFELPAIAKTYSELSSDSSAETESESVNCQQNKGNYKAVTELSELSEFVEKAISKGVCAFDTETDSLNTMEANLLGFSLSYEKGSGIYVPISYGETLFDSVGISKKDAFDVLKKLFTSKSTIVMHNAKYDIEVLASNSFEFDLSSIELADTMIAAWLLEPDRTGKSAYSLEYLSEIKLGLRGTEFSEIVPKDGTFADVPLETAAAYSSEDSDFTLQLWQFFEPKLKEQNLWDLYRNMEIKVLPILSEMEMNGIHLNPQYLKDYAVELKKQIEASEKAIYEAVGHEFKISSPMQLSKVLFEEIGLKGTKKTKTGYSTNEEVLEQLAFVHPVPKMILEYRGLTKLLSTYVEPLPVLVDENSRIHTTFMQTGTATGRLSSKDPNLQNIPVRDEAGRKIRTAFTAAPGTVLISADYAQIELVVMAHLSGDKNLCDAFNGGIDVHKSTASLIYGIPMEEVTPDQRRNAKTINFGVMYGMSAFRLANDIGISRTQAKEFIDNYFMVYSGVREFFDKTVEDAEENGFVTTIKGRKRFIHAINSPNKLEKESAVRIAKNTPIQGSAADIVKQAMIDVSVALKESGSKARLLLQVHDELILECPDDQKIIDETIALVRDKMEHTVKLNVPLKVSVEYGKNWGEFH